MPAYSQDREPAELPQTAPLPEERPEQPEEAEAPDAGDTEGTDPVRQEPESEDREEPPAAQDAPLPEERPETPEEIESEEEEESEPSVPETDGDATEDGAAAPEDAAAGEDDAEDEEEEKPVKREPSPPEPEDEAALRACRAALAGFGTKFEELDPILPEGVEQDGCGIARPFSISEILPGIELRPQTAMRCETALKLARWVENEVLPATRVMTEHGELVALDHGSTYVCRPRNGVDGNDISEHARGNAIDIMSFTFEDGRTVPVSPKEGDGTPAEVFQKAVGGGACLHFSTVLGPGADAYHSDHLHLDVIDRESEYLLCQSP